MTVEVTDRARRDLRRLGDVVERRVLAAVVRYATTGHGDVKRLQGSAEREYRLRVGDLRVRFVLDHERDVLRVRRVLPRGEAYR